MLFAWDGERYAFVTDLLGVGGIGYAVGPGEYAEPRPWENLLLPRGRCCSRATDALELKLGEPMEEACYLDAARLVAYDLPPGWQLVLDERMGIAGPEPTGRARLLPPRDAARAGRQRARRRCHRQIADGRRPGGAGRASSTTASSAGWPASTS